MSDQIGAKKDTILVVDDEAIVLRMATSVLGTAGYQVMVAENGASAFELFQTKNDRILLVLTDIIMPGSNGIELAGKIVALDRNARVLLMSGYSDSVIEKEARKKFPFIRKPFLPQDLTQKIQSILGLSASSSM